MNLQLPVLSCNVCFHYHTIIKSISAELVKLKRFSGKLPMVPTTPHAPHPTTDGDAVGTLLDICVEREWPLPTYVFFISRTSSYFN